jgi:Mce-associated membrane protein
VMTRDKPQDISTPETGEGAPAAATEETSAAVSVEPGERRERGRFGLPLGPLALGLALALLLAVGLAVVFGVKAKNSNDLSSARTSALATANTYAVNLTSYDYRNIDKDFARVLDGTTGDFKDQFSKDSDALRPLVTKYEATAKGKVVESAVKSANDERAEVLLFVDQTISNTTRKEPRVDRSRMVMTLIKVDDRWMIIELQLV